MTRNRVYMVLVTAAVLAAALMIQAQAPAAGGGQAVGQQAARPQPSHDKPAEAVFQNIKVMNGVPSDQLIESMQFFRSSLGVDCEFCHATKDGHLDAPSDDKPEKATARKMIAMTKAINDANFNGRQQITCASCHAGHMHPVAIPPIANADELRARGGAAADSHDHREEMPSADALLDKYEQAIGGLAAVEKLTTRQYKATITPAVGQPFELEAYLKAPNKALSIQTTQRGKQTIVADGDTVWGQFGQRVQDLTGPDADNIKYKGDFFRDLKLKGRYQRAVTTGKDKINGHDVYVVRGQLAGGRYAEQLYLDAQSGLLVRRTALTRTPFGQLPETVDLDDYREVNGVKVPFTMTLSTPTNFQTIKIEDEKFDAPIDDSKFAKPAAAPAGQ